ncbi:MAG: hypothetical protein QG597_960, partial [Actinomycetota bacterium]|nr:hypothetical protein [Actinomycetota bacterium]
HVDEDGHEWTTVIAVVHDPDEGPRPLYHVGFWPRAAARADAPAVDMADIENGDYYSSNLAAHAAAICYDVDWPHEMLPDRPEPVSMATTDVGDDTCPACGTPLPEGGDCDVCGWMGDDD